MVCLGLQLDWQPIRRRETQGALGNWKQVESCLHWILLWKIIWIIKQLYWFSLPALVGEADGSGVLRLARVLLLGGLLPLRDDVTHLDRGVSLKKGKKRDSSIKSLSWSSGSEAGWPWCFPAGSAPAPGRWGRRCTGWSQMSSSWPSPGWDGIGTPPLWWQCRSSPP